MKTKAELQARLGQILDEQKALQAAWGDGSQEKWDALEAEYSATQAQIQRLETLEKREAELARTDGRRTAGTAIPGNVHMDGGNATDDGGFRSFGELVQVALTNPRDQRVATLTEGLGGNSMGVLVPPQYSSQILQFNPETAVVRPRATVIPAGDQPDAEYTIPALAQGADGVYGGVVMHWVEEGGTAGESDAKLDPITLRPKELNALVTITDKLLANAPASSALLTTLFQRAAIGTEDRAFLTGDGVGKPLGMLLSPGTVAVKRKTANQVVTEDVVKMRKSLNPESLPQACWCISVSVMDYIVTLQDAGGRYIFVGGDITKGIPDRLLGIPIIWTGRTKTLGTKGDVMLCDFSCYLIKDGRGPFISLSQHVNFTSNKTVIKLVRSVDGQCWVKKPLTLEDGSTQVSNCVVLN